MIEQGTDGLSRGDIVSGVMSGETFLSFTPISKTAFERSHKLRAWLQAALPKGWTWLEAKDWYELKNFEPGGRYVWNPAPCAGEIATEKLCEISHMYSDTSHIFICPMLMTNKWRKQMTKAADVSFHIPVGCKLWEDSCHEPLQVMLTCPILSTSPYRVKERSHFVDEFGNQMQGLWREDCEVERAHLREFWIRTWSI